MKHVHQRNIKLINELMGFCYKCGASKINITIDTQKGETCILLTADIPGLDEAMIANTEKLLNAPRSHEMEEYYWELTGDDDTDSELTLVGMMTDEAYVNYFDSKHLEIVLKRRI